MNKRVLARELAQEYLAKDDPLGWFEALYRRAGKDNALIPWADLTPNPNLLSWAARQEKDVFQNKKILVVGCGLGDDANWLAEQGADVTAFDISSSAIAWCKKRFSRNDITFLEADILNPPFAWKNYFDGVFESYTLQVLPDLLRCRAIDGMRFSLKRSGYLLLIARGRSESESLGNMPWPLTKKEIIENTRGMEMVGEMEDFMDEEAPPVRRFRVVLRQQ